MNRLQVAKPFLSVYDNRILKPERPVVGLYTSPEWRQLVGRLILERGRKCEQCGRGSDGTPIRLFGDHVRELKDGGAALDERNVRLVCGRCHTKKTLAERAKRYVAEPVPMRLA